uniref:Uncharacterized protein n=1 Tax=Amphiprion percula TaxID=161767 RepID=A0A3P8SHV1_AMPPE
MTARPLEEKNKPRVTFKNLKTSLKLQTLNNNGAHVRAASRKQLFSKKNLAVYMQFAESHAEMPQGYWQSI